MPLTDSHVSFINRAYDALVESAYAAVVTQTRLAPYFDAITLVIDETGIRFDTTGLSDLLAAKRVANERDAFIDLVELNRCASATLSATGVDGTAMLRSWIDSLPAASPIRADLLAIDVLTGAATSGTERDDLYIGDANANTFSGGAGDDLMDAGLFGTGSGQEPTPTPSSSAQASPPPA